MKINIFDGMIPTYYPNLTMFEILFFEFIVLLLEEFIWVLWINKRFKENSTYGINKIFAEGFLAIFIGNLITFLFGYALYLMGVF
jgi:hypothetical protein